MSYQSPQQAFSEGIAAALKASGEVLALCPSSAVRTWYDIAAEYSGQPADVPLPGLHVLVNCTEQAPNGGKATPLRKYTVAVTVNVAHDLALADLTSAGCARAYDLFEALSGAASRILTGTLSLTAPGVAVLGAVWRGEGGAEPDEKWLRRTLSLDLFCQTCSLPTTTTTTTTTTGG